MLDKIKKIAGLLVLPVVMLVGVLAVSPDLGVLAQATTSYNPGAALGTNNQTLTTTQISTIIKNITNILGFLAAAVSVIFIIIGAFQWMNGDEEKGKERVKNAIIGLAIVIAAYLIAQLVVKLITPLVDGTTGITAGV